MEWVALGWRDGILLVAGTAAVYLVVMLLKLMQMGKGHKSYPVEEKRTAPKVGGEAALAMDRSAKEKQSLPPAEEISPVTVAPQEDAWSEMEDPLDDPLVVPAIAGNAGGLLSDRGGALPTGGFGQSLSAHLARSDMADMETEVQRMRDEMEHMRGELEELRAARRVSPQYAEAMELAQRGMPAQTVADRMGISLAEAELVLALSRTEPGFNDGEEHGEDEYLADAAFDRRRAG